MSSSILLSRCPAATSIGCARLNGNRLAFNLPSQRWGGFAASIVADAETHTWGVLWKLRDTDLAELDRWENRYDRMPINVIYDDSLLSALTYRVKAEHTSAACGTPAPAYLARLIEGAKEHELPADYVENLRSAQRSDTKSPPPAD